LTAVHAELPLKLMLSWMEKFTQSWESFILAAWALVFFYLSSDQRAASQ